jgi:hypothetical protein
VSELFEPTPSATTVTVAETSATSRAISLVVVATPPMLTVFGTLLQTVKSHVQRIDSRGEIGKLVLTLIVVTKVDIRFKLAPRSVKSVLLMAMLTPQTERQSD